MTGLSGEGLVQI